MKIKSLLFLVLFGCSQNENPDVILARNTDTVNSIMVAECIQIKNDLNKYGADSTKNAQIDWLISEVEKHKKDRKELEKLKLKIIDFKEEVRLAVLNKAKMEAQIVTLKDSFQSKTSQLSRANTLNKKIAQQLQDATGLSISGLSVKGLTTFNPIFGKPKTVQTTSANKVKLVNISFIVAGSESMRQGDYMLKTCIYSVRSLKGICKDILVTYTGIEQVVSITFDSPEVFAAGNHKVEVTLDKRLLLTDSLILK